MLGKSATVEAKRHMLESLKVSDHAVMVVATVADSIRYRRLIPRCVGLSSREDHMLVLMLLLLLLLLLIMMPTPTPTRPAPTTMTRRRKRRRRRMQPR